MVDLLVIGAGLSGLMAAHTAASAGLSVKVIAKGLGAMHWGAGAIDLLGYLPGSEEGPVQRLFESIARLVEREPDHPYGVVGQAGIRAALAAFVNLSHEIGLPYGGAASAGDNLLLPSPAGAVRPTYLAPQAQLAGDLSRPEPMLIVGFRGMRDFYPELIAENLSRQGYRARAAFLPLSLITTRRDSNSVHQAQALDDPEQRRRLAAELKRLVQPGERVGLPAILGLDEPMAALADLERQVAAPVFEIPTLPPSVPGVRLFRRLRHKLAGMGVRVEVGMEVIAAQAAANSAGKRVEWVESATSARPMRHRAQGFLLATGGILGGGFDSDHTGRVWEVVFDLPLTAPQTRGQWFHPSFINPDGHPVYHGGILVDKRFQPLDLQGEVVYTNLWAAGDLIANDNPILQRSLEGAAVVTGVAAGQAVAEARSSTSHRS